MSAWQRALLGALLGALIVLLVHPDSRPFYATYLWRLGDSQSLNDTPLLPENVDRAPVPNPNRREEGAYDIYLVVHSQRLRPTLDRAALERGLSVARHYGKLDPENAFWPQMEAFFLSRLGNYPDSLVAWSRASRLLRWNDYENSRLNGMAAALAQEFGTTMAWHYAFAYNKRSRSTVLAIRRYAQTVVERTRPYDLEGLVLRYQTIRNGDLIREGARSYWQATLGSDIVMAAARPEPSDDVPRGRAAATYRDDFVARLLEHDMFQEADAVRQAFDEMSWFRGVPLDSVRATAARETVSTLVTAAIPGVATIVGLLGLLLAAIGSAMERWPRMQAVFRPPIAMVVGVALGTQVYVMTGLPLVAIAVCLCWAGLAYEPANVRKIEPTALGWLHGMTLSVLGIALATMLGLLILASGAPGIRLAPILDVPVEMGPGSVVLIGLVEIVFSLTLLTAPAWGLVHRFPTARMAALALRRLGRGFACVGLLVAVGGGVLAVYVDGALASHLLKRIRSEPQLEYELRVRAPELDSIR